MNSVLQNFITLFNILDSRKEDIALAQKKPIEKPMRFQSYTKKTNSKFLPFLYEKRGLIQHTHFSMPLSHFAGHNLWLLKPAGLNRGRGIHVFQTLETLQEKLKSCLQHKKESTQHYLYI